MKYLIPFFVAILMVACTEEDSPQLKEALAIHEAYLELGDSLKTDLEGRVAEVKNELLDSLNYMDSLKTVSLNNKLRRLVALQLAFEEWEASVVEIPGHHHHEEGEACTHDHSQDAIIEGLPDDEILQMQLEIRDRLNKLRESMITAE